MVKMVSQFRETCLIHVSNIIILAENPIILDSSPVRSQPQAMLEEVWFATIDDPDKANSQSSEDDFPPIDQLPLLRSSSATTLQPFIKNPSSSGTPEKKRSRQVTTSSASPSKRTKPASGFPSNSGKSASRSRVSTREKMAHNLEMKKEENRAAELALRLLEAENKKKSWSSK